MILTQETLNKLNSYTLSRRRNKEKYQQRRVFNNEIKETILELKEESKE